MNHHPQKFHKRSPTVANLLVALFFRGERREVVLGDLEEGFSEVLARGGTPREAKQWYRWHAFASLGVLLKERLNELGASSRQTAESANPPNALQKPQSRAKGDSKMSQLWYEGRLAVRSLLRRPVFSLVAVLTLALGLGANAAIFSVLNGVVLKPLAYRDSDRLISVSMVLPNRSGDVRDFMSHPDIADVLEQSPGLASLVGYDARNVTLTGTGEPTLIQAARLTDGLMETFLITPALGRDIRADECGPGAPRIVVISHGLWMERFGMAADVLEKTLEINGRSHEVVGVAPEGFQFPPRTELWVPHQLRPESCGRACHTWRTVGRLAEGSTVAASQNELDTIAVSLAQAYPGSNTDKGFNVERLHDRVVGNARAPLWILLGAVAAVLLIACANVSNLLLIRASARTGEVALRTALGASRARLTGQILLESGILALAGGALGLLLATWSVDLLRVTSAVNIPRLSEIGVDGAVFVYTLGLVVVVTLVFGMIPAAYFARIPLSAHLSYGRGTGRARVRRPARSCLIGLEVALSVALLIGAGLLLRSFEKLYAVDLGFETRGIIRFSLSLPSLRYDTLQDVRSFCRTLEERVAALPGVESVGSIYGAPLGNAHTTSVVLVEGRPEPRPGQENYAAIRAVSPYYLETMRVPLMHGRALGPADDSADIPVGVVNEAFVRENFPLESPIGKKVRIRTDMGFGSPYWEIVGIVGDIRSHALIQTPVPEIYVPHGQFGPGYVNVNVRSALSVDALVPVIRSEVWSLDSKLPLQNIETVTEAVEREVAPTRFYLSALGLFAALALSLAAVGLYGVLGYIVAERTREIGIRIAMGASRSKIIRMILSDAFWPALAGMTVGIAVSFFFGRILESFLFDVTSVDGWMLSTVVVVVLASTLAASLVPARRAGSVDPVDVLRAD